MSKFVATYFSALCTMHIHAYTQSKELQSRFPKASLWHDYFTVWMRGNGEPGQGSEATLHFFIGGSERLSFLSAC